MDQQGFKFDFERLYVYQKAVKFTDTVFKLTLRFDNKIQFSLGDQFRRAALSVCNNIAEGSHKEGRAKKQFYKYALNSARECVPMITISFNQNQISQAEINSLRNECVEISRMMYKLIASV